MLFPIISFLAIEAYLFIYVLIPYLRFDQFQFWDAAGHIFAVWLQKSYYFPNFTGWNPFFACGYPQDSFYPPLYHYLVCLLSFPLGLPLAFTLLTALSVVVLPFSIYYFARKFKFNPNESALSMLLVMVPIAGLALANGGTLFSQFIVGLGANSLCLPLFLFYFGKLKEQIDKLKDGEIQRISPFNFFLLTLLSVVIVLTHFVIAFAAAIAALVLIFNAFKKESLVFAFQHAAITLLICGFFILPMFAYMKIIGSPETILSMGFFLTVPLFLLIVLGGAACAMDKDKRLDAAFFVLLAIFSVAVFMDFGQIGMPMHSYRFIIYFLIFAMLLPIKLVLNRVENKFAKIFFLGGFFILMGWQTYLMVISNPRAEINNNRLFIYNNYVKFIIPYYDEIKLEKLTGRILILSNEDRLTPRAIEHELARKTGNYFLRGLFGDNGNDVFVHRFCAKAVELLARKNWEPWQLQNMAKIFKLFQVNYFLSETPIKNGKLVKRVAVRRDRPDFYLYKIGDEKVAEVVYQPPYFSETNWLPTVYQWFESPDPRMLVKAASLPKTVASPSDSIESIEESLSPARLKFKVRSKEVVPILIKISYFPRWRAYVEGKPVKIYQTAPALMLIYGKGNVVLEYKPTEIDNLGGLLTLLGITWFGLNIFFGLKIKKHLTRV